MVLYRYTRQISAPFILQGICRSSLNENHEAWVCTRENTKQVLEWYMFLWYYAFPIFFSGRRMRPNRDNDSKWYQFLLKNTSIFSTRPIRAPLLRASVFFWLFRQGKRDYWLMWFSCRGIKAQLGSLYGASFTVVETKFCFPVDTACHNFHKRDIWGENNISYFGAHWRACRTG